MIPLSAGTPGYAAIVLPNSLVFHVIYLFMRSQRRQGNQNESFFSMEKALNWLKQYVGRPISSDATRPATTPQM